jgi:hypothetical protein
MKGSDHDDPTINKCLFNIGEAFQTTSARHTNIKNNDFGYDRITEAKTFVNRMRHDNIMSLTTKVHLQHSATGLVIIDN